jgi:hypothetical protein
MRAEPFAVPPVLIQPTESPVAEPAVPTGKIPTKSPAVGATKPDHCTPTSWLAYSGAGSAAGR